MLRVTGHPGNKAVFKQIERVPVAMKRGLKNANLKIGKVITEEAVRTIKQDPKSGKFQILQDKWTGALRMHRASAPGESPANFSGALAASIGYVPSSEELKIGAGGSAPLVTTSTGQIGFSDIVNYAKSLELKRMRPYLKPSIVKKQKDAERYYYQYITRELLRT